MYLKYMGQDLLRMDHAIATNIEMSSEYQVRTPPAADIHSSLHRCLPKNISCQTFTHTSSH
jgi:hypothetical protein